MFNAMLMRSRNKKGFTLMEMLIVVAIIAILVAVSFPVFTAQLTKAQTATDQANVRSAKAVAMATYLTEGTIITADYFDAQAGLIKDAKTGIAGYCQGATPAADTGATNVGAKGNILEVSIIEATDTTPLEFKATWVAKA